MRLRGDASDCVLLEQRRVRLGNYRFFQITRKQVFSTSQSISAPSRAHFSRQFVKTLQSRRNVQPAPRGRVTRVADRASDHGYRLEHWELQPAKCVNPLRRPVTLGLLQGVALPE